MRALSDVLKLRDLLQECEEGAGGEAVPQAVGGASPAFGKVRLAHCSRNAPDAPSALQSEIWPGQQLRAFRLQDYESADRALPEHELLLRQSLEVQDVYLGLSEMDPSSASCQELLLRVRLPGASLDSVWLESDGESLWVQSFDHSLLYALPRRCDPRAVRSQWAAELQELRVSVPRALP